MTSRAHSGPAARAASPRPHHPHRPHHSRRGGAGIAAAALVAIAGLSYMAVSTLKGPDSPTSASSATSGDSALASAPTFHSAFYSRLMAAVAIARQQVLATRQLTRALAMAGVTPEGLAAGGVTSETVATVVSDARGYLTEHGTAFWAAMDNYRAAVADHDAKARKVASGVASSQEKTALDTACTTLASTASARASALAAFSAAATASLSEGQRTLLATVLANKGHEVPLKYLTTTHTEAEWVALREALANVRTASVTGEEADSGATALIADADSGVSTAAGNLENSLAAVTTAWSQALAE